MNPNFSSSLPLMASQRYHCHHPSFPIQHATPSHYLPSLSLCSSSIHRDSPLILLRLRATTAIVPPSTFSVMNCELLTFIARHLHPHPVALPLVNRRRLAYHPSTFHRRSPLSFSHHYQLGLCHSHLPKWSLKRTTTAKPLMKFSDFVWVILEHFSGFLILVLLIIDWFIFEIWKWLFFFFLI